MGSPGVSKTSGLSDDQKKLVSDLVGRMTGQGGTLSGGATPYGGPLAAQFVNPMQGEEDMAVKDLLGGGGFDDAAIQKRFQSSVVNPSLQAYDQYIAPRIKEGFGGGGFANTSRQGDALSRVLGEMGTSWNSELSNMMYESQKNRVGAMTTGVGLSESNAMNRYNAKQVGIGAKYSEFLRTTPEQNPWIQYALALTGQPQMVVQQKPDRFGQLLSLGGALGAAKIMA